MNAPIPAMRFRARRSTVSGMVTVFAYATALLTALLVPAAGAANDTLWSQLAKGGLVVLMRHSRTQPGAYDPDGWTLQDCNSQRQLSDVGRAQARRIGAAFHDRAIPVGRVLSSRFCRCIDTAALAFGSVEPWEMLDNIGYDDDTIRGEKRAALREAIARWGEPGNLVLVTHGFNIRAAIGVMPAQGEMLVLKPRGDAGFSLIGSMLLR